MVKARRDWFTIVATDLFAGSFAAVVIIDSVTPKEIATLGNSEVLKMSFAKGPGNNCTDPNDIVFGFVDDTGDRISTLKDARISFTEVDGFCEGLGIMSDTSLSGEPSEPFLLVVEYPSVSPGPVSVEVSGQFDLTCDGASGDCL